ncbi:HAD family hydrolase [Halapricum desulfuricans]|uniref:HAD superfamily hydrolase n=1 Tax=Halapricum desulfuricans TaxID=2841257 RepID=A0A897N5I7_9EURY|nr:HAD-IA family hydrolase [Halapricum desulfuricans]QSG07528.1 HAD superfamily hydrolase [Halapricum desulfuricans]
MPAVLFDMDGVVIDSERYWPELESERLFPEVVPGQDVDPEEVMGMNYREIYDYLAENYEVAVDRDRHVELFDELAREIYGERASLMDGFDDLLSDLQARGIAVGLVTSSPPAWIDVVLERFGLTGRFDAVVSAENVPSGKPEPDVYRRALQELDAEPDVAVAVEDSTTGANAANAAGIRCLGYAGVHDGIDPEVVDAVVSGPERLRTALFEQFE